MTVLYAKPDCPRCKGTGWYAYDHNHSTVCNLCCTHHEGWWLLKEHYGENNGKWCCCAGCGKALAWADIEVLLAVQPQE
jgi:hypothetical protein